MLPITLMVNVNVTSGHGPSAKKALGSLMFIPHHKRNEQAGAVGLEPTCLVLEASILAAE